jgi:hypothetical protein
MPIKRKKRNYKEEYRKFQSSPKSKKDRAKRNKARRAAMRAGRVHKGDGNDVHHTDGINSSKTRVMSRSKNRGIREKSRLKGSRRRKIGRY